MSSILLKNNTLNLYLYILSTNEKNNFFKASQCMRARVILKTNKYLINAMPLNMLYFTWLPEREYLSDIKKEIVQLLWKKHISYIYRLVMYLGQLSYYIDKFSYFIVLQSHINRQSLYWFENKKLLNPPRILLFFWWIILFSG